MNIVLINQWYSSETVTGGVAKYNFYIANAYRNLGHNVYIISKLGKGEEIYKCIGGINIYRIRQLKILWPLPKIPFLGSFFILLRDIIYSFSVRKKLFEINKKFKVDIAEYAEVNVEGIAHSIFGPNQIPFVVRSHTPYFVLRDYLKSEQTFRNSLNFWMEKFFIKRAPLITTPSRDLADLLRKSLNIPQEKIKVVPNGIDTNKYRSSDRKRPDIRQTIILFVGRIERAKGVFILAEAFCRLKDIYKKDEVRCIFVGEDRGALSRLKEIFRENDVLDKVEFKGKVSEKELIINYQNCDIFVNPSLIYESFSYTCLEAMSCGKPVIASMIGGIPEVVVEGKTGFLFEPGKAEELAAKLTTLIRNPEKRKQMGEEGRKRAEIYFDVLSVAETNLGIYKEQVV